MSANSKEADIVVKSNWIVFGVDPLCWTRLHFDCVLPPRTSVYLMGLLPHRTLYSHNNLVEVGQFWHFMAL